MSQLAITEELLHDLQAVLSKHHPEAADPHFRVFFMMALTGFMAAERDMAAGEHDAFVEQLLEFGRQVIADRRRQRKAAQQDSAFGIWRPEED